MFFWKFFKKIWLIVNTSRFWDRIIFQHLKIIMKVVWLFHTSGVLQLEILCVTWPTKKKLTNSFPPLNIWIQLLRNCNSSKYNWPKFKIYLNKKKGKSNRKQPEMFTWPERNWLFNKSNMNERHVFIKLLIFLFILFGCLLSSYS